MNDIEISIGTELQLLKSTVRDLEEQLSEMRMQILNLMEQIRNQRG